MDERYFFFEEYWVRSVDERYFFFEEWFLIPHVALSYFFQKPDFFFSFIQKAKNWGFFEIMAIKNKKSEGEKKWKFRKQSETRVGNALSVKMPRGYEWIDDLEFSEQTADFRGEGGKGHSSDESDGGSDGLGGDFD